MAENTTVWNPSLNGEGEFAATSVANIADPSGTQLVDPSNVSVVDTGQTFSPTPSTVWSFDAGA